MDEKVAVPSEESRPQCRPVQAEVRADARVLGDPQAVLDEEAVDRGHLQGPSDADGAVAAVDQFNSVAVAGRDDRRQRLAVLLHLRRGRQRGRYRSLQQFSHDLPREQQRLAVEGELNVHVVNARRNAYGSDEGASRLLAVLVEQFAKGVAD